MKKKIKKLTLDEALLKLETEWGKNVGFYGIPPCKDLPNGGYKVNLIPKNATASYYMMGLTEKEDIVGETLYEAVIKALAFLDLLKSHIIKLHS